MDDEIKGEGNSINYEYRMHDPRIGRFFAVDPLAPKYPHYSPYQFSGNRPIDCVELEGLEPTPAIKGKVKGVKEGANKVVKYGNTSDFVLTVTYYYHGGGTLTSAGYYTKEDYNYITVKQTQNRDDATNLYASQHPINAFMVGEGDWNDRDLSSSAAAFSYNAKITGSDKASMDAQGKDGTRRNAYRHTLWQTMIAYELGADVAEEIGNAHEDSPNLDLVTKGTNFIEFSTMAEADTYVDLRNNRIGRQQAVMYKEIGLTELSRHDLATYILDYFNQNGLWVVSQEPNENGKHSAYLHKLSQEDYDRALDNINKCDNFGYNESDPLYIPNN
jgi:hypothetical protein